MFFALKKILWISLNYLLEKGKKNVIKRDLQTNNL